MLNKVKSRKKEIAQFAILSIALTLPLNIKLGNFAIISSFVLSLFFINRNDLTTKYNYATYFPFIFLLIVVISSLCSKNISAGFSRLDRHLLPLLLTVICIVFKDFSLRKVFQVFTFFLTGYTTVLIGKLLWGFLKGIELNHLVFHQFTALFGQHPVYYGLLCLISLFFLLSKLKINFIASIKDWKWILQITILLLGLLLCASKAVFVIFIIVFFCGLIFFVKNIKILVTAILILGLLTFFVSKIDFFNKRLTEGIALKHNIIHFTPTNDFFVKKQFNLQEKLKLSDLELRVLFAKIAVYHMQKDEVLLFGYGVGDAQNYFDYYLYSYNLGPNWYQGFNLHNQYLHIFYNYGVFVLIFFLLFLASLLYGAYQHRNFLQFVIIISFCFVFLFEVVLIRNKGIVLFYFFNLLFLINNVQVENRYFRNQRNSQ